MSELRSITDFLALRRNTTLLLVALVLETQQTRKDKLENFHGRGCVGRLVPVPVT